MREFKVGDRVRVGDRGRKVWEVMSVKGRNDRVVLFSTRRFVRGEVRTALMSELRAPK